MKFYVLLIWVILLMIGCRSTPQPMYFKCALSAEEFHNRAKDSLFQYKFSVLSSSIDSIASIKRIDDGMSDRTVYLTLLHDSLSGEATMYVRTLVRFQGNETEIFLDEKPRLTNDFRSDFRPLLSALRTMCEPPPRKKKK